MPEKKPEMINWDDIPWETTKAGKPTKKTREALERVMNQRLAERVVSSTKWDWVDGAGVLGLTMSYYYGMDILQKLLPWDVLISAMGMWETMAEEFKDLFDSVKDLDDAVDIVSKVFTQGQETVMQVLGGNIIGVNRRLAKTIIAQAKGKYGAENNAKILELQKAIVIAKKMRNIAEAKGQPTEIFDKKIENLEKQIVELKADTEDDDKAMEWLMGKLEVIKIFSSLGLAVVTLNLSKEVSWSDLGKMAAEAMPL